MKFSSSGSPQPTLKSQVLIIFLYSIPLSWDLVDVNCLYRPVPSSTVRRHMWHLWNLDFVQFRGGFSLVKWSYSKWLAIIYLCIKTSWIQYMKLKLYYILSSGQTGHLNMPCQTPREFQCSIPERRRKLGWRQALWHKPEFQREMRLQQLRRLGGLLQIQGQLCLPAEFQANSSYIGGPCLRKAKVKQLETATNKTKTICGGGKKVRFLVLINYS